MAAAVESPAVQPDTPMDGDEVVYPCKGCGDILEEGKAFELAGNRWHIDCFRCNTCGTLLDSDANLLLLGDGSLICNNCTYSCHACGNKIEDLAILTGEQAFCANCFKCRNCKRKIENLRYARTSSGIFCMTCHEALMARRRGKKKPSVTRAPGSTSSVSTPLGLDKSLPALPFAERHNATGGANEQRRDNLSPQPNQYPEGRQSEASVRSQAETQHGSHNASISSNHHAANASKNGDDSMINITFDPSPGPPRSTDRFRNRMREDEPRSRSISGSRERERNGSRPRPSPHVAYQDRGRIPSSDSITSDLRKRFDNPNASHRGSPGLSGLEQPWGKLSEQTVSRNNSPQVDQGAFRLQEAPRTRASSGSARNSNGQRPVGYNDENARGQENGGFLYELPADEAQPKEAPPIPGRKNSARKNAIQASTEVHELGDPDVAPKAPAPKKEDNVPKQVIPRKEVSGTTTTTRSDNEGQSGSEQTSAGISPGTKLDVTTPLTTTTSPATDTTTLESFAPPPRSSSRPGPSNVMQQPREDDTYISPREAPAPPASRGRGSVSHVQPSELPSLKSPVQPGTPAELPIGDDESAKLREEDDEHPGLFRKVSKAVRHGRSASDKLATGSSPKWPKTRNGSVDISSPIITSPDAKEDAISLRNKLKFAQSRIAELESEKNALQDKVNGSVEINQVNRELLQKRSTVDFLDTQAAMVTKELEIMTDHLQKAKDNGNQPLNIDNLKTVALRDFAQAMTDLKGSLASDVEKLMKNKNDLTNEISSLIQMKDKGFQEYESLTSKNQQLSDLNNQLVQNIQDLYKQNRQGSDAGYSTAPNSLGLGIYNNVPGRPGSKPESPMDGRGLSIDATPGSISGLSGDTEVESAGVAQPQVVKIGKGQVKKFNWKKPGQSAVKNVTKGFKGAFGSSQPTTLREEHFIETTPYGGHVAGDAPVMGDKPLAVRTNSDQLKTPKPGMMIKSNSGLKSVMGVAQSPDVLFGSELTARCEFEGRTVPGIVLRCIEEVELRGMDMEGIYRKSGSFSQLRDVQQGFEDKSANNDISDPDLDIHAVSGAMKQYFRKLPNPLITFDCYEYLLDVTAGETGDEPDSREKEQARIDALRKVVKHLPKAHRDTLEVLLDHLVRVMERQKQNLMTVHNLAVVFAPTIARPAAPEREMTDMEIARKSVEQMLTHARDIFPEE